MLIKDDYAEALKILVPGRWQCNLECNGFRCVWTNQYIERQRKVIGTACQWIENSKPAVTTCYLGFWWRVAA
jgi:hypothetical protein